MSSRSYLFYTRKHSRSTEKAAETRQELFLRLYVEARETTKEL